MAAWTGPAPAPQKWVFLVGCYSSGTTLLHDLLASHPDVASLPREGQFCTDQFALPWTFGLRRLWAAAPDRFRLGEADGDTIDVVRLKRQWGSYLAPRGRPVAMEKSPPNAARMLWLQRHFENAHFVGIVRDGRAVSESIRRYNGYAIEFAALQWRISNEVMLADFPRLERGHMVRYEDLISDAAGTFSRVLEFLGLDATTVAPGDGGLRVAGNTFKIRGRNQSSLDALSDAEHAAIRSVAGPTLDRLGYGDDPRAGAAKSAATA